MVDAGGFRRIIDEWIASPENTLKNQANEPAWATPLIGFSSGADPIYEFYRRDIGDFYRLPSDFMEAAYPGERFTAGGLTVVSWVLPHTDKTKLAHRGASLFPSEAWARARIMGEEANNKLRANVVQ